MKERSKVVCLTPVKNEAWIIEKFICATLLWADYLIIADQKSDDGTKEIIKKYKNVILVENNSDDFNEPERQKLLLNEARKIKGKKLLVALDADEFMTGNIINSKEWEEVLFEEKGTVLYFKLPLIHYSFKKYWGGKVADKPFGFIDDGSEHCGNKIHSIRIPHPKNAKIVRLEEIQVMHYQFTDWKRMESKHLWYQCYEAVNFPEKNPIWIYRAYHHMYTIKENRMKEIPSIWFDNYKKKNIEIDNVKIEGSYRWDIEVQDYINQLGEKYFRYIDFPNNKNFLLSYLRFTHKFYTNIPNKIIIKVLDKILDLTLRIFSYY